MQNETMRNVIPSHAHEAKSANYAIWRYDLVARDGVVSVYKRVYRRSVDDQNRRALYGLSRQTPRSSVGTGDQLSQDLYTDSVHPNWIDKHGR